MRVLVTWGSKHGGTTDIAEQIAHVLREQGHDVHARPAEAAPPPRGFQAVIIGGAVYANRWAAPARRYVEHHIFPLRHIPTWMFSTGATPPREIRGLMARIGAIDHATLITDSEIGAWATEIAEELPHARPRPVEPLHGRAIHRLVEYGTAGWAITLASCTAVLAVATPHAAVIAHSFAAPLVFGLLAHRYQEADGARSPLVVATVWTLLALVLDFMLLSPFIRPQYVFGIGAPVLLAFATIWVVGAVTRMTPAPHALRRSTT